MDSKRSNSKLLICLLVLSFTLGCICQVSLSNLSNIGVIPGKSYNLKILGITSHQYIVLKLLPNLENVSDCAQGAVANYKLMLNRVLTPINETLSKIKNAVRDKPITDRSGENFWGAVIGGIALGIATVAQITGSVALHNSLENAKAIRQMKESIRHTNQAIEQLQTSTAQTILAVNALQDQINTQFVPAITSMGCQIVSNSLGLRLNQYFSEISLVFGPNLRDPASETLSIQAISRAFNRDFDTLLKKLGYSATDLLDLIDSEGIRGRIIDVDLEDYFIVIQMEYPALTVIPDATIQTFNRISFNQGGEEWISVFPNQLLVRNGFISQIDITGCLLTENTAICEYDTSYPAGPSLLACARGDTSRCAKTRVVTSHVPRFALSRGVLFANCLAINCRCVNPEFSINQEPNTAGVMIHSNYCQEVLVGNIYITVGPKVLPRSEYSNNITVGQEITVDPIDIGNELALAQLSLNKSRETIEEAKRLLEKVNPRIINMSVFSSMIALIILAILWVIVSFFWLVYLTKKVSTIPTESERQRLLYVNPTTLGGLNTYGT
nr:MAG: fusion protein [Wenzhou rodent jeilongvirus 2]WPV62606.1 MAG: fusion protein [Wenzhou rodent jeilongvirus 2]